MSTKHKEKPWSAPRMLILLPLGGAYQGSFPLPVFLQQ
jgi:hypothetical protein